MFPIRTFPLPSSTPPQKRKVAETEHTHQTARDGSCHTAQRRRLSDSPASPSCALHPGAAPLSLILTSWYLRCPRRQRPSRPGPSAQSRSTTAAVLDPWSRMALATRATLPIRPALPKLSVPCSGRQIPANSAHNPRPSMEDLLPEDFPAPRSPCGRHEMPPAATSVPPAAMPQFPESPAACALAALAAATKPSPAPHSP